MRRYHHGDLKIALVAVGRDILEQGGVSGLSLREVARRAGVSHAAPAHHFASLGAFLSECAESGFGEFADAIADARRAAPDVGHAIAGMGRGYLGFARKNPVVFRLMFNQKHERDRSLVQSGNSSRAYAILVDAVRDIDQSVPSDELAFRVSAVWSLVHGYADLMLEGRICAQFSDPDVVLARTEEMAARALLLLIRAWHP